MPNDQITLIIEEQEYIMPAMVVEFFGKNNIMRLTSDLDSQSRYELLKRFDDFLAGYIIPILGSEFVKGKAFEISRSSNMAVLYAKRQEYDRANDLLWKSIKNFLDIYDTNINKIAQERRQKI